MLKFVHDTDAMAIAIPWVFSQKAKQKMDVKIRQNRNKQIITPCKY